MTGMRVLRAALVAAAMLSLPVAQASAAAPTFVPKPSAVYEGFVAINGPRAEVPVGALWIDGYGPHGDGAAPDNLETVRGLTGITINRDLELSLTAGLLDLLGVAPGLRKHFQARFTDLSIVRVKDLAGLSGPAGEPRIIEAMKAGTILVTTDSDVGFDLERPAFAGPFVGRLDSGSKRGFAIEGRDMFIAMRVATATSTRSAPELVKLKEAGSTLVGEESGLAVQVKLSGCTSRPGEACPKAFAWQLRKSGLVGASDGALRGETVLSLPVPRADGQGGLFTSAELSLVPPCDQGRSKGCGSGWRAWLTLVGSNIVDLPKPRAPRW